MFRVTVALGSSTTFSLAISDGATTVTAAFNGGVALNADTLYGFTFVVDPDYTYNFRPGADSTVPYMLVEEVRGEVA